MSKVYKTERLHIKTLDKDAAPMVLSFYEDNKTLFEPWEPKRSINFYTLLYQKASLTAEYNQIADRKLLRYWIFTKENPKEIVGSICFQNILREPYHSCSLGYKLSHKYLHQGYAHESIQKCIQIVFEEHGVHRMEAFIMPCNEPSIHLIEKLAFHYEGISRSYARINDQWADHLRFALINPYHSTVRNQ